MARRTVSTLILAGAVAATLNAVTMANAETTLSTQARTDLALTIYGNGLGLVSDRRWVDLSKGLNSLAVDGLSPQIITDSLVTELSGGARVLSRERRAANLTPRKLMATHVGKAGYLIRNHPETGAEISQPATLLSVQGGVVARIGARVVLNPVGRWAFDRLPTDARPRPALMLSVASQTPGRHDLALRYLTGGLSWRPVHTAHWRANANTLEIESWAVLSNKTGSDFDEAWVRLVAGQVHRVSRPQLRQTMARGMKAESVEMSADASRPTRQNLAGYHLYRLPATVTLRDGGEVQVALMDKMRVNAERQLISEGFPQTFGTARARTEPTHPVIQLSFVTPTNKTAQPLPGGMVRLYGNDRQGMSQFIGEDRLNDIPVGGKAKLDAGRAFDVTVERVQTSFRRESRKVFESGHQIKLHNGGAKSALVTVVETIPGNWTILDSDQPHERDGGREVWKVDVPGGGNVVLSYRVRVKN
jgi:hypothetical protein